MNEFVHLLWPFVAGMLLGMIFFGGLWVTVSKGISSKRAALWFLVSMFMRTSIVVIGIYYVGEGQLDQILASLLGFLVIRMMIAPASKTLEERSKLIKEESHD